MRRFSNDQATMKMTCIFCNYSHMYEATEEQFEAYVERKEALNQIFPDMPDKALVILDNGQYCKDCMTISYGQRVEMLAAGRCVY